MIYLGISLILVVLVIFVMAHSEIVRKGRIQEMAHQFASNHILDNLEIKRGLLADEYILDAWELEERLLAINMALHWQRTQSLLGTGEGASE